MATIRVSSWDLTDLVKDPSSAEFKQFLNSIEAKVREFELKHGNLSPEISPSDFEQNLHLLEEINEKVNIASGYAHLRYYADTSSNEAAALLTRMEKLASDIANSVLFFDLWFKKELSDEKALYLINSVPEMYREYLRHKRLLAKHTLTEPEEKIINTLNVTSIRALVKIYDKMTSAFDFTMKMRKGRKIIEKKFTTQEKLVTLVRSPDPKIREGAYRALWEAYRKHNGLLGEIYQNIVIRWRDEEISMRRFKSPISVRNILNNVDDETVTALLSVCRRNATVFQEYFKEKAKMIGLKNLRRYDLYAPLSSKVSDQKRFSFSKAVDTVLKTFTAFDPRFRELAERVFDEEHVDSAIRKGKRGGAFCYTITPRMTPYVLLNFDGRIRDVSTLAHEFGHAIHSMAASDKSILVSQAPLPLAEMASVFAEALLVDEISRKMSAKQRRLLLAEEIDDMYATIMRQAYFTLFEIEAHREIAEKNATIDEVSKVYLENLKEQFGSSVSVSSDFRYEWLYVPHFYHTPFYCYAYSFGNLLVLSLYQQYKLEGRPFVPKYFNILAAGGSRKPEELLEENGIDIRREEFWQKGFDYVNEKVQQLKAS
jgi:oligoendopeptidase F